MSDQPVEEKREPWVCPECGSPHSFARWERFSMDPINLYGGQPLVEEERECTDCHETWICDYEKGEW